MEIDRAGDAAPLGGSTILSGEPDLNCNLAKFSNKQQEKLFFGEFSLSSNQLTLDRS